VNTGIARALFGLAAFATGFCRAPAAPDFTKFAGAPPFAALASVAANKHIPLQVLDALAQPRALNPGDSITALVAFHEKGAARMEWLLYLEALPASPKPPEKPMRPMVLYSCRGNKLEYFRSPAMVCLRTFGPFVTSKPDRCTEKDERFSLDEAALSLGLDQAAGVLYKIEQNQLKGTLWFNPKPLTDEQLAEGRKFSDAVQLTAEQERALGGMFPALFSYLEIISHTEGLEDIFLKVVEKPTVWSVIGHLGVKVELTLDSKHVGPADASAWGLPANVPVWYFPILLELNQHLALTVTMVVTTARPPLLPCGGIIGMLAENPGEKGTYLTLRVVSARNSIAPLN